MHQSQQEVVSEQLKQQQELQRKLAKLAKQVGGAVGARRGARHSRSVRRGGGSLAPCCRRRPCVQLTQCLTTRLGHALCIACADSLPSLVCCADSPMPPTPHLLQMDHLERARREEEAPLLATGYEVKLKVGRREAVLLRLLEQRGSLPPRVSPSLSSSNCTLPTRRRLLSPPAFCLAGGRGAVPQRGGGLQGRAPRRLGARPGGEAAAGQDGGRPRRGGGRHPGPPRRGVCGALGAGGAGGGRAAVEGRGEVCLCRW